MSAHFNAALSLAEWSAYRAGRSLERRDDWMQRARNDQKNCAALKICVNAAREANREYLKNVAIWRALQKPKRKRA